MFGSEPVSVLSGTCDVVHKPPCLLRPHVVMLLESGMDGGWRRSHHVLCLLSGPPPFAAPSDPKPGRDPGPGPERTAPSGRCSFRMWTEFSRCWSKDSGRFGRSWALPQGRWSPTLTVVYREILESHQEEMDLLLNQQRSSQRDSRLVRGEREGGRLSRL